MSSSDSEINFADFNEDALLELEFTIEEELVQVQKALSIKKRMMDMQEKKKKLALLKS